MVDTTTYGNRNSPALGWTARICALALLSPAVGYLAGVAEGAGDFLWAAVLVTCSAGVGAWCGRSLSSTRAKRWLLGVAVTLVSGGIAFVVSVIYVLSH